MSENEVLMRKNARITIRGGIRAAVPYDFSSSQVIKMIFSPDGSDWVEQLWLFKRDEHLYNEIESRPDEISFSEIEKKINQPVSFCLCKRNGHEYINLYPLIEGKIANCQFTVMEFEVADSSDIEIDGKGLWLWEAEALCSSESPPKTIKVVAALTDLKNVIKIKVKGQGQWVLAEKIKGNKHGN